MMPANSAPRSHLQLNGTWQVQPGETSKPPVAWLHEVPVPALVDIARPGYAWSTYQYHWYRETFMVAERERSPCVFLKIGQAMFGTEVWLNGERVGGDIACYTSQEYDIGKLIRYNAENELLVRVGARETLPPESAVGKDQEKQVFIPGIWGDASIVFCGNPRVKWVQVIPHVDSETAEARITIENRFPSASRADVSALALEKNSHRTVSGTVVDSQEIGPYTQLEVILHLPMPGCKLWRPESPFLYELDVTVENGQGSTDRVRTTFGMREFKIVGSDFFLNGKRILLRGSNIAFHRLLSDPDRGTLPWDANWIRRVLIEIPKAHFFNSFRCHLGHMYNLWYDIADEYGMLIQNEWQFWGVTGTKDQIRREFTQWLRDNWNHPSIIIWDALNESTDKVVQREVVPEMKNLDPTRPWESVDFIEDHPYIYSLGPVLNDRRMGYTRSLQDIENLTTPAVVNEFLWWWLDKEGKPTSLTQEVVERWMGRQYSVDELLDHQAFLAQELVELFRRMRVDVIQPFVYLSNSNGPTGHWFLGPLSELRPKPVLAALKNAFSPLAVSIELWDRHFMSSELRTMRLFVLNDDSMPRRGIVRYGVVDEQDCWLSSTTTEVHLDACDVLIRAVDIVFPEVPGTYFVEAELQGSNGSAVRSRKVAHVVRRPVPSQQLTSARIVVLDRQDEIFRFLTSLGIPFSRLGQADLSGQHLLVVAEGMLNGEEYRPRLSEIRKFVAKGHTLIVLEPDFGVQGRETITVVDGVDLEIERRPHLDRGGYDSFVFADDYSHPLWNGLTKEHLKFFNGALGGEIVSQCNVTPLSAYSILARCGSALSVIAVAEVPFGSGRVIVSRLQTRGRLVQTPGCEGLYCRRVDPIAQQYFLNLFSYGIEAQR